MCRRRFNIMVIIGIGWTIVAFKNNNVPQISLFGSVRSSGCDGCRRRRGGDDAVATAVTRRLRRRRDVELSVMMAGSQRRWNARLRSAQDRRSSPPAGPATGSLGHRTALRHAKCRPKCTGVDAVMSAPGDNEVG